MSCDNDSRLLDMPGHLIRRLQQIASALFLEQAKAFDFTPVQYAALVAIKKIPASIRRRCATPSRSTARPSATSLAAWKNAG